jgi:CheY-like chemotaxis protein
MRPKHRILCVDDNEQALSIRKFMLETHGYRVFTATSGPEAIERFREGDIELVLSDFVMPLMDGNELMRHIKKLNPGVPTILISGTVESFDRATAADAFFPKGANSPLELLQRLKVMMRRKTGPKPKWPHQAEVAESNVGAA